MASYNDIIKYTPGAAREVWADFKKKAEAFKDKDKLKPEIKKYIEIIESKDLKSKGLRYEFDWLLDEIETADQKLLEQRLGDIMVLDYATDLYLKEQSETKPEPEPETPATASSADAPTPPEPEPEPEPEFEVDDILNYARGDFGTVLPRFKDKLLGLTLDELKSEHNKYVRILNSKGIVGFGDDKLLPDHIEIDMEKLKADVSEMMTLNYLYNRARGDPRPGHFLRSRAAEQRNERRRQQAIARGAAARAGAGMKKGGAGSKRRKHTSIRKYTKRRRVKRKNTKGKNTKRRRVKRKNTRRRNY